jgi:hypothetical protein
MKTRIHVHQHLEVTAPSNKPSTISIENTMHLLSWIRTVEWLSNR